MKVEQEKIKEILLFLENSNNIHEEYTCDGNPEDDNKEVFHILMLRDAGFIEFDEEPVRNVAGQYLAVGEFRMTYQGNEYLQTIKDEKIWDKIKGYPLSVAKELGKQLFIAFAKDQLGLK